MKKPLWHSWSFWAVWAVLLAFGFSTDPKKVPSPLVGKPAPDFEVTELGGTRTLKLSDLQGTPVVINFWASWCAECRVEAHILESFHQKYKNATPPVAFIGIAIQDSKENAMAFKRRFNKTYFLALDDVAGTIALDYGIYGVPETYFIDVNGIIRKKHIGAVTPDLMENTLPGLSP